MPTVAHPLNEKLNERVPLNLGETMVRDLERLARQQDRAVSECIRVILYRYLYGHRYTEGGELPAIDEVRPGPAETFDSTQLAAPPCRRWYDFALLRGFR